MFLNYIALLTALSISGVAAYYSIYGLTAIFSGVFWPIVIMGGVLEFGKIVTTVWLHTYWHQLKWLLKTYMSLAVAVLMFITSMGIFGYLSRAHIEVTSQAGGGQLLVQQVDQNIVIEQKRIDDARKIMSQMDDTVNSLLKGSGANAERDNNRTAQLAQQATKLRDSQKKERDSLNNSIDQANNRITELNKQKLKLEQEQLKMEAEVGPIKYIAQLMYDDAVGKDLLEKAVRWVIIVIVAVFDPLAVAMVLGVTMVMNNRRREREIQEAQRVEIRDIELPVEVIREVEVEKIVEVPVEVIHEVEVIREVEKIVEVPVEVIKEVPVEDHTEIHRLEEELAEVLVLLEEAKVAQSEVIERIVEVPVEVVREVITEDTTKLQILTGELDNMMSELHKKDHIIRQLQMENEMLQEEVQGADQSEFTANASSSNLGPQMPETGELGQLFVHTLTNRLFKYSGDNWVQVDPNQNTSYTYDTHWQHWMLGKLSRAELDWDDLTVAEQSALEQARNES